MNAEGKNRILIADDSEEIRDIIEILLTGEGYEVVAAKNEQEAIDLTDDTIDLFILDVVMPIKSGFRACVEIRNKTTAPILFLTAKAQDSDKTMGFSSGGDDYLAKPFSYAELISRVKSLLRRYFVYQGKAPVTCSAKLTAGDLTVDTDTKQVHLKEKEIFLTDIEYQILVLMLRNKKKVFSAADLYEQIWQEPYFYSANNTVMVHIRNLRKKIETDPQNPLYLKTVWGKGYYIG
ncbi:MAG: response regulator transcription factor [Peptococcaceae bacterium]|jgi:two-component system OmpR family response regulator|nr:response regulator transcription factor [Peptococcaceae bacterium]